MLKKYFLLLFFLCFISAKAQNAQTIIDNLKAALKNNPDAKKTATIYSDLTWYYATVSTDSALYYGKKAMAETRKLGDSTMLSQVYSDMGAVYFRKNDFKNSKINYQKAYAIRKARNDFKGLSKTNVNLASIYVKEMRYKAAMKSYLEALDYFENINDDANVANIKSNIGAVFVELRDYRKAIKYLGEAIAYAEKSNDTDKLCTASISMGNAYCIKQDSANAWKYYNKSLQACNAAGNKLALATLYNNIGSLKSDKRKSAEAQALFKKSQDLKKQLNLSDQNEYSINMVSDLIRQEKYAEAHQLLIGLKNGFEKAGADPDVIITYKLMLKVHAHLNQPDSIELYSNKYTVLRERLYSEASLRQLSELETKYRTAQKEKQLLEQQMETRRKNNLLIGVSVLTFFIILISILIYRQQKLRNRQQKQEFKLKTAIAQIETQNRLQEQRLSISRDLHDNIGAQLTFIISSVDNIKHGFDIQNIRLSDKLLSISEFTKSTIVELRDTIWAMNNSAITFEDLKVRILNFIEKAKMAKEDIHFSFEIDERLNALELSSIEGMNIYRTIQEAVNNAIKYADAENIAINASAEGHGIFITVTDNGTGFDAENINNGNGLHNMRKRIEDIDGDFEIKSAASKGTKISISLQKQNK
jgi:signal transduction histidine kinase